MSNTSTFYDPSEDDQAVKEAEARALQEGERLAQAEEDISRAKFESARKDQEEQVRYAGKYKSAEELERAYKELEKKLGEKTEAPAEEEEAPAEEQAEEVEVDLVRRGLEKAAQEFDEGGAITPETLDALSELDSRTLVETWAKYISETRGQAEQTQVSNAEVQRIYQSVGGQQAYTEMTQWAAENLSAEEIGAYDSVVNSGNLDAAYWAVQGLKAKYSEANGNQGKRYSGGRAPAPEPGFRSHAELAAAIRDPRYNEDPAYRLDVEAKLARSGDLI
jgi:hypothetical protein